MTQPPHRHPLPTGRNHSVANNRSNSGAKGAENFVLEEQPSSGQGLGSQATGATQLPGAPGLGTSLWVVPSTGAPSVGTRPGLHYLHPGTLP